MLGILYILRLLQFIATGKKKLLVPKRAPRASSNTGAPTHTLKEEEDVYAGDSLLSHHHKSAEYT